jgi:hypothetical protein
MRKSRSRLVLLGCVLAVLSSSAASERGSTSPAARASKGGSASEYWDVAALFESGHRVFARFSISNEGPGDETAYAIGQVVFPDGTVVPFTNGRRKGRWQLSEDGLRMEIGSSVLDLREPVRKLEVDKNTAGIKLFLRFEVPRAIGRPWLAAPRGYQVDQVAIDVPVTGTLWVRDVVEEPVAVRGSLSATHTWMEQTETDLMLRRLELHSAASAREATGLYLLDLTRPGGHRSHWLVLEKAGEILFETGDFELNLEGRSPESTKGYPLPARLRLSGPGFTGDVTLGKLLVRHDPLSLAPQPFRWFLSFRTRPSHVWLAASYRISLAPATGEGAIDVEGSGVLSAFFLNPMRGKR